MGSCVYKCSANTRVLMPRQGRWLFFIFLLKGQQRLYVLPQCPSVFWFDTLQKNSCLFHGSGVSGCSASFFPPSGFKPQKDSGLGLGCSGCSVLSMDLQLCVGPGQFVHVGIVPGHVCVQMDMGDEVHVVGLCVHGWMRVCLYACLYMTNWGRMCRTRSWAYNHVCPWVLVRLFIGHVLCAKHCAKL